MTRAVRRRSAGPIRAGLIRAGLKLNGYEEILYTNATGSVLVVTYLRPGRNATVLHDGRSTPIPWSPYIGIAAW